MSECWEHRGDVKGRPARICGDCPYYKGRNSGAIAKTVKCHEHLQCNQPCTYKNPGKPNAHQIQKPSILEKRKLLLSRSKLLTTAQRMKVSLQSAALPKPSPDQRMSLSPEACKLIAQALRLFLKERNRP